ncbi:MAG: hypothetical protein EOM20_07105 [Spartobacteria bacterium]|nr:hypothetical protein [Spartobacteria bacterium]
MLDFKISQKTKKQVIDDVKNGHSIDDIYLKLLTSDIAFCEGIKEAAKESGNIAFVRQLKNAITAEEHLQRDAEAGSNISSKNPKRKKGISFLQGVRAVYEDLKHIEFKKPKNYCPTGTSFEDFAKKQGVIINEHPNSTGKPIKFVQGGAPGQGKRA